MTNNEFINKIGSMDIQTFYGTGSENTMLNLDKYVTGVTSETQRSYEKVIYNVNIDV